MTVAIVAAEERHLPGIHNDAVLNSTAIWNEDAVDLDNRRALLIEKRAKNQPYLVAWLRIVRRFPPLVRLPAHG